jgi:hypothetical protein
MSASAVHAVPTTAGALSASVRGLSLLSFMIVVVTACSSTRDEGEVHDARNAKLPAEATAAGDEVTAPPTVPAIRKEESAPSPTPPAPAMGCEIDADCVRVDKGCCQVGEYIAVRKDNAAAYQASLQCAAVMCPTMIVVDDHSVAQCNTQMRKCEVVNAASIECNGFTMNPHACPDGFQCILPEHVADVPGKCFQRCAGFAGLQCSDPDAHCMDDPTDTCHPNAGGADCGGLCVDGRSLP